MFYACLSIYRGESIPQCNGVGCIHLGCILGGGGGHRGGGGVSRRGCIQGKCILGVASRECIHLGYRVMHAQQKYALPHKYAKMVNPTIVLECILVILMNTIVKWVPCPYQNQIFCNEKICRVGNPICGLVPLV